MVAKTALGLNRHGGLKTGGGSGALRLVNQNYVSSGGIVYHFSTS
jgi:hypothetical protein